MKKYFLTLGLLLCALVVYAADGVNWSFKLIGDNTMNPAIEATANIEPGFHLFSIDNPDGGSSPLEFFFDLKGCELDGKPVANKAYTKEFDEIFEVDQHFYTGKVVFTQKLKPTDKSFSVNLELKGQTCNDSGCVPVFASHSFSGTAPVTAKAETASTEKEDASSAKEEQKDGATALAEMTDSLQASEPFMTPEATCSPPMNHGGITWKRNFRCFPTIRRSKDVPSYIYSLRVLSVV
mgnify:CR=1 FL=1